MPFVDLGCYHCQWQKSPSQNRKRTGSIPPSCRGPSSSKLLWDGWQDYPKWCRQTQVLAFYICSCHSSAVDSVCKKCLYHLFQKRICQFELYINSKEWWIKCILKRRLCSFSPDMMGTVQCTFMERRKQRTQNVFFASHKLSRWQWSIQSTFFKLWSSLFHR